MNYGACNVNLIKAEFHEINPIKMLNIKISQSATLCFTKRFNNCFAVIRIDESYFSVIFHIKGHIWIEAWITRNTGSYRLRL